jgi:hypothetical protein
MGRTKRAFTPISLCGTFSISLAATYFPISHITLFLVAGWISLKDALMMNQLCLISYENHVIPILHLKTFY